MTRKAIGREASSNDETTNCNQSNTYEHHHG